MNVAGRPDRDEEARRTRETGQIPETHRRRDDQGLIRRAERPAAADSDDGPSPGGARQPPYDGNGESSSQEHRVTASPGLAQGCRAGPGPSGRSSSLWNSWKESNASERAWELSADDSRSAPASRRRTGGHRRAPPARIATPVPERWARRRAVPAPSVSETESGPGAPGTTPASVAGHGSARS